MIDVSRRSDACQYGSRDEFAIIVERHGGGNRDVLAARCHQTVVARDTVLAGEEQRLVIHGAARPLVPTRQAPRFERPRR